MCSKSGPPIPGCIVPKRIHIDEPVTYVTGKFGFNDSFRQEVRVHCKRVALGWMRPKIDRVICLHKFPDYVVNDERFARHRRFLSIASDVSRRGGGYWFWKALIIHETLHTMQDDALAVYTDNDQEKFIIHGEDDIIKPFVEAPDASMAILRTPYLEHDWAKEDVLTALNATREMRFAGQYAANIIVMRNTPSVKRLVAKWIDVMADWHLVSVNVSVLCNGGTPGLLGLFCARVIALLRRDGAAPCTVKPTWVKIILNRHV